MPYEKHLTLLYLNCLKPEAINLESSPADKGIIIVLPLAIFISMIFLSITHANFLFFEIIFFGEIIYLNSQNFFNLNT